MTDHISDIKGWFETAVPNPTDKNRSVQLGCHIEEVCEMLGAIGDPEHQETLTQLADYYKTIGLKAHNHCSRTELLDALCDQIVTAVGVAHMFGMDIEGALAEVTRSNYSKFVDGVPVFNANGKIAKPATYSKPDLAPFL